MKTDHSTASFWHSYTAAEKAAKLLTGTAESLAPNPTAVALHADDGPDNAMLEVVEYHP